MIHIFMNAVCRKYGISGEFVLKFRVANKFSAIPFGNKDAFWDNLKWKCEELNLLCLTVLKQLLQNHKMVGHREDRLMNESLSLQCKAIYFPFCFVFGFWSIIKKYKQKQTLTALHPLMTLTVKFTCDF